MKTVSRLLVLCLLASAPALHAAEKPAKPPVATTAAEKEAIYTATLETRSNLIMDALKLENSAKATRVKDRIIAQYRALNHWQESYEDRLKELRKPKDADAAKTETADIYAKRRALRDAFLADLAKDLTPDQIDTVKDKLTYNKLQVTYHGYLEMLPTLTEDQKAQIHTWLVEARDDAIDGVSSDEKSAIFNRYKGRINNYLSKQGYDLNRASKEWKTRIDAAGKK